MRPVVREFIDGHEADELWELHHSAFADLRTTAAQRHYSTREEFDDLLRDKSIAKHVVVDDAGRAVGMATTTTDIGAVSLISAEYYTARWPEHAAEGRIWYLGFLAVHPDAQNSGAMIALVQSVCAVTGGQAAVMGVDFCDRNAALPQAFLRVARGFLPAVEQVRLDAQTYWAFETPATA